VTQFGGGDARADQVDGADRAGEVGDHLPYAGLGQRHRQRPAERPGAGEHDPGGPPTAQDLCGGAGQSSGGQGQRAGLRRQPGADRAGQVTGEQAVRGHQQAGRTQGVEQRTCLVGGDPDGGRLRQDRAFAAGAVEQVEQMGGSGIGQLQQHGGPRADAELEGVPVPPEPVEAGQQRGTGQYGATHGHQS
jgi:hypothetical protein